MACSDTTCKNTPNYQLCVSILSKDPQSTTGDIRILGLILVDAIKSKAEETVNLINELKKTNPELMSQLNHCSVLYYAVLEADIPEAIEALTKGGPKFAENGVADAVVEAQECEMGFNGSNSPLSGANKSVREISNVAREVIRMLL
ncbi:hypothetical protein LIER_35270 [Lithospermum erythrorhizon]|uniref:Pectinesterase inhibitor domain-containing protein n=1 Tax=Lithospermum erythrorhizon TaxID=34254 RepID=A0AAV3NQ94_LITER